ncbi:Cyp6a23 [Drosophila busckii]|uniref:Cyp6a23 n=3 Tax=Drosophila busckii TaxID=30019 RepID=A0A0M4EKJ9_DROBS|nr:Cyp6a23 [Drosophila busckii]
MSLIVALVGIIVTLLLYAVRHRYNYWNRRGIPHDVPKFPKGNLADWMTKRQLGVIFKDYYMKYKGSSAPFAGFYFFFTKTAVITDLDLVKRVLIKDFNNFENRGVFYNEADDPLSATLFSIEGRRWRNLRHKLTPTFTSGKMKHMMPLVLKVADELALMFESKVPTPQVLEITDLVGRFTADVIGNCAFGLDCNSQRNPEAEFVNMGKRAVSERRFGGRLDFFLFGFPKVARALHMKSTVQEVEDFYLRIVRDTINYRLEHKEKRHDFMDMLIELYQKQLAGNTEEGLSFEELAAQAFIFFVAGFETSSTTMGFALYELAQHQDIQDKLRAEINAGLVNNEFSYDSIKQMSYLEQVVMETLRKYPVLPHLTRQTNSDYSPVNPQHYIQKGTIVVIPALGIHFDPDIYPAPHKFQPERFTESEIAARPACTWLPFGDGPRNCIGSRFGLMQTCVGLAYLIKNFKFTVAAETIIPMKLVAKNILLTSENGIYLKVEKISK